MRLEMPLVRQPYRYPGSCCGGLLLEAAVAVVPAGMGAASPP